MRAFYLTVALLMVAGVAYATPGGDGDIDVYTGMNTIGISRVPFVAEPWNAGGTGVFNPEFTNIQLHGRLYKVDATTGAYNTWNRFSPAAFGNCLLGDGYWLNNTTGVQKSVVYTAVADGVPSNNVMTDMWVSLPGNQLDGEDKGGNHLIGLPFDHQTNINKTLTNGDNIFVTDGTELKTLKDAATAGWCLDTFSYWDNASGQYRTARPRFGTVNYLSPDRGYWFTTKLDNLALIIPAY